MITTENVKYGLKYHKDPFGNINICTASIRKCPYEHFDSAEDAYDTRSRTSFMASNETVKFSQNLDADPREDPSLNETIEGRNPDIRTISNNIRNTLQTNGRRPVTVGDIEMGLPGNQKFVAKREVYDVNDRLNNFLFIAVRYQIRHYSNISNPDGSFKTFSKSFNLDSSLSYQDMQSYIEQVFIDARENTPTTFNNKDEIDKKYAELYEKAIQSIDETEIMSRGADVVYKTYGIDLFKKDKPGELNISSRCSKSAVQAYDIVDALKIHSSVDDEVKKVSLNFYEEYPYSNFSWSIDRIPEGEWYFSYSKNNEMESFEINRENLTEVRSKIIDVMSSAGVNEAQCNEYSNFGTRLYNEVEPAIKNYESIVYSRISNDNLSKRNLNNQNDDPKEKKVKKSFFNLF